MRSIRSLKVLAAGLVAIELILRVHSVKFDRSLYRFLRMNESL